VRRAVALAAVVASVAGCRPAASPPPAHAEAATTSLTEGAALDEAVAAEEEADDDELRLEEGRMGKRERARAEPPILIAHNRVRAEHCAEPLTWSDDLAAEATAWANQLAASGCVPALAQQPRREPRGGVPAARSTPTPWWRCGPVKRRSTTTGGRRSA
jgi:hypothetical protein